MKDGDGRVYVIGSFKVLLLPSLLHEVDTHPPDLCTSKLSFRTEYFKRRTIFLKLLFFFFKSTSQ